MIELPREHLSFTQIDLWLRSPESYRKQYYPKIRPTFSTMYTRFGNEVTEAMERGEKWVAFIPRHKTFEHPLLVDVGEGVKVKAYIDNVDLDIADFNEQKTTMKPWSENKIKNHLQFPLYSMLLQIDLGIVTDKCHHIWAGTKKVEKDVVSLGHKVGTEHVMELTGEFKKTPRVITQEERDECRKLVIRVGKEIAEDYKALGHLYY